MKLISTKSKETILLLFSLTYENLNDFSLISKSSVKIFIISKVIFETEKSEGYEGGFRNNLSPSDFNEFSKIFFILIVKLRKNLA